MKNGWLIYDRAGAGRNEWFIKRLTEACFECNISLKLLIEEDISYGIFDNEACIISNGERLERAELAVVRAIDPLLSHQLESMGVRTFNSARVSEVCNDKRRTHILASDLGIPTLDTVFCDKRHFDRSSVHYPCILKSASGHGGSEVFYITCESELLPCLEKIGQNEFLLQTRANISSDDIRVYVMGQEVLAQVKRSSPDDFRSNYSLGGTIERVYDKRLEEYALNIASSLASDFVGVDFIVDGGKIYLNEVEDVVGTRMLYALGITEVCELYARYISKKFDFFSKGT